MTRVERNARPGWTAWGKVAASALLGGLVGCAREDAAAASSPNVGFVLVDDASPETRSFDGAIRRALARAFPRTPLRPLPTTHTLFRSFYLLRRAEGRVRRTEPLEAITVGERVAVLYSRHDLGGAWARDNLGSWRHSVVPGGEEQRERAIRLGVNIVMYALCLDYKDDQVHAPFIMRRRGGAP